MVDFNTTGIVLKYTNINESDRMLTVFSPEMGKLSVLARGCRKPGSKFLSAVQLFSYGNYTLRRYKEINILVQVNVYNNFFGISRDMLRLANASYLLNLTEEAVHTGEGNPRLFNLLLKALTYLSYDDTEPEHVVYFFELKYISLIGYQPELYNCINCGLQATSNMKFSPEEGGLICNSCDQNLNEQEADKGYLHSIPIKAGTVYTMRHMLEMDISGIKKLKFYPEIQKQLDFILSEYIFCKLDKRIKSREFIKPEVYRKAKA